MKQVKFQLNSRTRIPREHQVRFRGELNNRQVPVGDWYLFVDHVLDFTFNFELVPMLQSLKSQNAPSCRVDDGRRFWSAINTIHGRNAQY